MNSLLSNLRRSRDRRTKSSTSSSKAKPLDILPDLTELSEQEDEGRASTSSHRLSARRASVARKRDTPLILGVEGLFFDGFMPEFPPRQRPAPPAPRARKVTPTKPAPLRLESPLDSIDVRFSGLEFPFSQVPGSPTSLHARSTSPSPSISSVSTTSSAASASSPAKTFTPPTSDDESHDVHGSRLVRKSTVKSQHGLVGYIAGARKQRSVSEKSFVDLSVDNDDDASWFAQDIGDSFVLSSHDAELPETRPTGKSRFSKPLPTVPRFSIQSLRSPAASPSVQLDPTFPSRRNSYIPSRPPPPPPIRIIDIDSDTNIFIAPPTPETPVARITNTMEEKTEELLTLIANAALSTTPSLSTPSNPSRLSTGSSLAPMSACASSWDFIVATPTTASHAAPATPRPPPRSSVPADIFDALVEDEPREMEVSHFNTLTITTDDFDLGELELEWTPDSDDESPPATPRSTESASVYSQASMPIMCASDFDLDSIPLEPCTPAMSMFFAPADDMYYAAAMPDSPLIRPHDDPFGAPAPERALRSRWSSSTLAESFAEGRGATWMGRFAFGSAASKKTSTPGSPTKSAFSLRSPTMPSFGLPKAKPASATPTKKPSAPASGASPSKKPAAPSSTPPPGKPARYSPEPRGLSRRESNVSLCTIDSCDSTFSASSSSSSGRRRKPIPIEIFMRA
ncbi:hypothetical protein PHLGIDRAFT_27674 [Phlebiopsis gigantea 11061_1 CR5-6]|uniref:Uncharacterized protein n=1 Tax=Phlebiopsis gigantea (strain 11061_1 CR5-6) TaxID=745531 RepID=A0A0C3S6I0_PHLG1|nr:hypothetical protein PHLGIDRAFT_27674 [Phlebiopsis gigantea 11061_1 CR5-6]